MKFWKAIPPAFPIIDTIKLLEYGMVILLVATWILWMWMLANSCGS
jgi:hypothetical protein